MLTVEALRAMLGLLPHPVEGGYFVETYRSADRLPAGRPLSTAIYYLLTPETFSAMHRLASDEVFHFYMGDAVEMLQLWRDGSHRTVVIGTDLSAGERPQVVVPGGVWQGARLRAGGRFALLGTTVAPGFDYAEYEPGSLPTLLHTYPSAAQLITALTRP